MYSDEQRTGICERYHAYEYFSEKIDEKYIVRKVNLDKFTGVIIEVGLAEFHAEDWFDEDDPMFMTLENGMLTIYQLGKSSGILFIASVSKETFDSYPEEYAKLQAYITEYEPVEDEDEEDEEIISSVEKDDIEVFYEWLNKK